MDREELKGSIFGSIGVTAGELVMAHTSVNGIRLTEGQAARRAASETFLETAKWLVDDLLELVGETGTLVMPTYPFYQAENDYSWPDDDAPPVRYDPATTPCDVGLANELFWRRKGVRRSLHPYNPVAACGPLAEELLHDNLNDSKPLPHGIHSAYYRFCQRNGLVVGIGVRLGIVPHADPHGGRDARRPVAAKAGHFGERTVYRQGGRTGQDLRRAPTPARVWNVLPVPSQSQTRSAGRRYTSRRYGGRCRVDWARSRDVFEYCMSRNRVVPYPYFWTWLVRKSW